MSSSHDYEPKEWPSDSSRIDAISQNGNDGLHYPKPPENKYEREIANASKEAIYVDVYDVLMAYEVKNPALAHAIKKMLCTGIRGYKDFNQDIDEAIQALERAKEL